MDEPSLDLAHTVALGSIDDEDHDAVRALLARPAGEEFLAEVTRTREALGALAEITAAAPPPGLRARLLAEIAAEGTRAS